MKILSVAKNVLTSEFAKCTGFTLAVIGVSIGGIYGATSFYENREANIKAEHEALAKQCTLGADSYRQRIINSINDADKIREDFKDCMKGNTNRDVVYNDTNELSNSCRKIAYDLNNAININYDYNSQEEKTLMLRIEKNIHDCGGK